MTTDQPDPSGQPEPAVKLTRVLTRARLPLYARLVAIGILQAAGSIGAALLIRSSYHGIGGSAGSSGHIAVLALALVAAVCLSAGTRAAERVAAVRLGQHYVTEVRAGLFEHLTKVPARHLTRRNRGNMLLRFVGDLAALRSWVSLGLAKLLVAGIAVGLAVGFLVVINRPIGLVVTSVLMFGAIAIWATSPALMTSNRTARTSRAKLMGEVAERLTHIGVLQASGQQQREQRRVGRLSADVSAAMIRQARAAGLCRAVAEGTSGLAVAAVIVVGAAQAHTGHLSTGTVLAAVTVVGVLTGHLRDLGRVVEYAAGARVARAAALRFLALPELPDPAGLPDLVITGGRMEIKGVTVAGALTDVTLCAEPGQTVAIVGANGAGKSTLVALAARLLDPDSGTVLLDGQDLRTRTLASVRAAIGVAGPDLPLLRGTVERNVLYRKPRAGKREIARVTELCGLDGLLAAFPRGWQTEVGEAGGRLSAGQRARIMVARAALGNPKLLILDEAEAHLDQAAADMVDRVIADHSGTALVVTHRRELVEQADVVWCLEAGRVVEVGPPQTLLCSNGPTARLLNVSAPQSAIGATPADQSISVSIDEPPPH